MLTDIRNSIKRMEKLKQEFPIKARVHPLDGVL